jgi:hypothetical protein
MVQSIRKWLVVVMLLLVCGRALGMAEEDFGDKQLFDANYKDWPNIMPLLRHPGWAYHIWVNGNEFFYYVGNTDSANEALKELADVKCDAHEVVIRPGPGVVKPMERPEMNFNWRVQIVGGIAAHMSRVDKGELVWPKSPVVSVYVGKDSEIDLEKIEAAKGVNLISLAELKSRTKKAMATSTDQDVRGWGAGHLAELDPYDAESVDAIAKLLKDPVDWVRLCAAGALASFGKDATNALPALRAARETKDESLKTQIDKTIEAIEKGKDNAGAKREHDEMLNKIEVFLKTQSGQ